MSAGPSRSRVTRIELTADQLLGADLIPARPHKPSKHAPKVITVEQLLGSSLTITPAARGGSGTSSVASPSSSRSTSRTTARPPPNSVRSMPTRSPSPLGVPVIPTRERVTADEVLRTGVPLRTLQAAKQRARSGQALVLTAEQLLGSSSGAGSSRSNGSSSSRLASESGRRPNTAGDRAGLSTSGYRSGRVTRPSTAGATTGGDTRGQESRPRQARRRSSSLGSTHTLPIYTKEPGESEVVIDRGAGDLEDEIPITVMTPVEEDGPSLANGLPSPTSNPGANVNPDLTQRLSPTALTPPSSPTASNFATRSHVINPPSETSPIPIPAAGRALGARLSPYPDEVPSYEAVMSMSTPDLHGFPRAINTPLPSSPTLSGLGSPRALSPSTGTPSTPANPYSHPSSPSPPSPDGADSPRRRFGFMSLFHAHPHSNSHSYERSARNHSDSVSGLPSQIPEGVAFDGLSPEPSRPVECPRPRLRSSRSVLDLLSRSWSDNHVARSRSSRGPGGA